MKKVILASVLILTSVMIFSFTPKPEKEEITVTVTAGKETMFDMSQNGKTVKGLTTPYTIKFKTDNEDFIFKLRDSSSNLSVKAESRKGKISTNGYQITVLVIDGSKWSVFGMK